ncbi:sensor histidine kinase [Nocardia macrotermitis]|uniref:histidine kinase n=1 Tax=Nocardia macrotermitis TaxID=2585198 RepID=A0A7K0CTY2_9NOCA|nr:histidine kinase [Nocardia macrotermitis]MQY16945.1 hypothetical protein [Nocardia macrotermitis]
MGTDTTTAPAAWPLPGFAAPLIERLGRFRRRLLRVDRAHPWILDAAVTLLVFLAFGGPDLWEPQHSGGPHDPQIVLTQLPAPVAVAFQAGLLLPLLWRRRAPTAAFGVIAAVFLVQWLLGAGLRVDAALLVALYSVALRARPDRLLWACAAAAAVMVPVSFRVASGGLRWEVLFFLLSAVTAAVALGLVVRARRIQLAALRERAAQLEIERDQRSRLAAATERTRVAREMHDIIGHNLSVIITVADGGAYAAETDPARGREALLLIGDAGRQALGELRRMLGVLRERGPEHAEALELEPQPGIADLETLFSRVRAAGTEVVYHSGGVLDGLDRGVQLMAYRIVQEALTNTLKHVGPGSRADVTVTAEDSRLRISVRDSGRRDGSAAPASPGDGQGLAGMRERAALYGGTVTAGPTSAGGWLVEAILVLTDTIRPSNSAGGQQP